MANNTEKLTQLTAGMPIVIGDRVTYIEKELAERFSEGDSLIVVRKTGDLLHIPKAVRDIAADAVSRAVDAFNEQQSVSDDQFTQFYTGFAERLSDEGIWNKIKEINEQDVSRARERGRSTTRLVADEKMRKGMISGLLEWRDLSSLRESVLETIEHDGWVVEKIASPCGVVAFVFEGRPNVLADATGVLRSGNTAVFRIGSDALNTARAIMDLALIPALEAAGLPKNSVVLLDSVEHAAGWALFADTRLALAVARGSGRAVDLLGAVAREAGNATSLHGTGGAWIIADETADPERFELAIYHSTDRKVCNTVNTICIPRSRAGELVPRMLEALKRRGDILGHGYRLHIADGSQDIIPKELFETEVDVLRAGGISREPLADVIGADKLGHEWEWEQTPEVTVAAADAKEAVDLFNQQSPHFIASLISESPEAHEWFLHSIDAPFVGNGFTRWVDGQYCLNRPELGLSNWQYGRLFGRGGILSGDGVFTIKLRVKQSDPDVHR